MSLTFETARITGLHHKVEKPGITGKIEITGVFTAKIAEEMGARWVVFDKEQIIKGGFKSIELDYALQALRLKFTPKGNLDKLVLDVPSQGAGHFKVMTLGDGKKKAKKLLVKFKVDHAGSQVPLIQYLEQIGGAEGKLELLPDLKQAQKQMFGDDVKPEAAAETARAAQEAAGGAIVDKDPFGVDEEEDPRAWRKDEAGWPVPNKHGVYNERHAQTVKLVAKGGECRIYVIEAKPDTWAWGYEVQCKDFGVSHPLSGAPLATKRAAIVWALKIVEGLLQDKTGNSQKSTDQIYALYNAVVKMIAESSQGEVDPAPDEQQDDSFLACMKRATNTDQGRTILRDLETAIAALERRGGIKVPTVGPDVPNIGYRGFSVVTPREWKAIQKRIRDNGHPAIAKEHEDLITDGQAANSAFEVLLAKEYAQDLSKDRIAEEVVQ